MKKKVEIALVYWNCTLWLGQRLLGGLEARSGGTDTTTRGRMGGGSCVTRQMGRTRNITSGTASQDFASAHLEGIVSGVLALVIGVKKFLKPLDELEIVLEATFHQLVDWDDLRRIPHVN
jgi:hypothetical protein